MKQLRPRYNFGQIVPPYFKKKMKENSTISEKKQ